MKYVIDTDGRRKAGVKQVQAAIRKVQTMYPGAMAEEILWGFAHLTAAANMDLYFEAYLPGFAKACGWTAADTPPKRPQDAQDGGRV
jgi:ATP-dependent protease HslVU (ClpYQ) peptidase subunit